MRFIPIFEQPNGKLFTVHYDNEEQDAFQQLFENWEDPEYLFDFFTKYEEDLNGDFYQNTIEEAIHHTREDAELLKEALLQRKDEGKLIDQNDFEALFKPLSTNEYTFKFHKRHKAYGPMSNSWLRIYAIKIEDNFIITGGAIKLTKTMQERPHTQEQLSKLNRVINELQAQGIFDADGLTDN